MLQTQHSTDSIIEAEKLLRVRTLPIKQGRMQDLFST